MYSCGGDKVVNKLEELHGRSLTRWIVPPTTVCLGKLFMYSSYGNDLNVLYILKVRQS